MARAYHCELEGLKRAVDFIGTDRIATMVTDRHRLVAKWIRENLQDVKHYCDVWHISKDVEVLKVNVNSKIKTSRFLAEI